MSRPLHDPGQTKLADDGRLERIRRLTEVSRALTYATSLDEVLTLAVERSAELTHADRAVLMLVDVEGRMEVRATHGIEREPFLRFREPLDETLVHRLQGLLGAEDSEKERFLAVPLVARGEVTGLLAVMRRRGAPHRSTDEWILSALADQAAVALENARLSAETERKLEESRRAMEGSEQVRDRALHSLAHDVRSPIGALDSYAALLSEEVYGPLNDRQREAVSRIRLIGRHLLSLADSMVEMARVAAGAVRIHVQDARAAAVVEEAAEIVLPKATSKQQSLTVETDPSAWVRADPDRLRQVLVNVLDNAVKFAPEGGSVRITMALHERDGRRLHGIAVTDNGPGVAPDRIDAIFEPYYGESGDETSLGLGLAIARGLVDQMGGEITVNSVPGHGSTFTVWLPLGPAADHR